MIEKIIEEGMTEGQFHKTDPKLQAYAIIGMCNWIYKWYSPGKTRFSPEQIGEHFIHLLEAGYLLTDSNHLIAHGTESFKKKGRSKKAQREQIHREIKKLTLRLNELIADLEKL